MEGPAEKRRGLHGAGKGNEGSVWCRTAEENCLCQVLLGSGGDLGQGMEVWRALTPLG